MRICVIGLGSIGSRHIKNMYEIYGNSVYIDILRSGQGGEIPFDIKFIVNDVYFRHEDLPKGYDAIFITNPTSIHYKTLIECQDYADNFFIEKPVFETGEEDITQFAGHVDKIYYVACPLRYMNVIQYLKQCVDFSEVYSIRCISSSYLPDWRPNIDYRNTYSAHKHLGGGVAIDLIHEWDYLCYLVGKPFAVYNFKGKKSNLEIDSDDIAVYIAEYNHFMLELHLDYFGRVPTRKIELYTKKDVLEADLIKQTITYKRTGKVIEMYEDRDVYQKRELKHFMDIINRKCDNDNDIVNACDMLRLARGNQ